MATDLALHIASEIEWCGRSVRGGLVLYVASESGSSVQNRVSLWARVKARTDIPFAVISRAISLLNDEEIADLIAMIADVVREHGRLAAIFIDTLARSIPGGDENAARDMGSAIAACDRIRETFTTLVCLVHHCGKDAAKGARGHSSLRAAVDTEILVEANSGHHLATITKQRDDQAGTRFQFELTPHVLGIADDGAEVTACLVAELAEISDKPSKAGERLTSTERIAFDVLHGLLSGAMKTASTNAMERGAKIGQTVVDRRKWRKEFYARGPEEKPESKRQSFYRATNRLQAKGLDPHF